jgi:hypothetical protein
LGLLEGGLPGVEAAGEVGDFVDAGAAEDSVFAVSGIEHQFVLSDGWTFSPTLSSFSYQQFAPFRIGQKNAMLTANPEARCNPFFKICATLCDNCANPQVLP